MNIRYEIVPDHPDSIPDLAVKMRAFGGELRGMTRGIIAEAIRQGEIVARQEAPRGPIRERSEGSSIRDAIQSRISPYQPGGAGGGGFYQASLSASSALAPHLRYVMEGTADQGRGLIRPSRGSVFPLRKEGETLRFRPWVHGQRANTLWWDNAHRAVQESLDASLHGRNI